MSWAKNYINQLSIDGMVSFRPRGNSMDPKIKSGQKVTIKKDFDYEKGDVVFCKVGKNIYLHLISAIKGNETNRQYQISNNKGHINGWTKTIYGKVIKIEN